MSNEKKRDEELMAAQESLVRTTKALDATVTLLLLSMSPEDQAAFPFALGALYYASLRVVGPERAALLDAGSRMLSEKLGLAPVAAKPTQGPASA